MTKTVAAKNMVLLGLEEIEGMKRIGILKTSECLENVINIKKGKH